MLRLLRSMKTLATLNAAGRNYASKLTGATVALHPVYLGKLITFHRSGFTGEIQRTNFSSSSSSYEFLETMPSQPIQATNFRYCSERNYPIKLTGATVALHPVYLGKLITIHLSGFTDQTISGVQMEVDLSLQGVLVLLEVFYLHGGISGNFMIPFASECVLPVDPVQGIYGFKVKLLSNDGHELSCVAFDFTVGEDILPDP